MRKNNEYILDQWKKLYPYGIIFILAILVTVISGNLLYSIPTLLFLFYASYFLKRNRQKVRGDLARYFQYNSPIPLIEYYSKSFTQSNIQDKEVWLAYNKALVLCYYGRFAEAIQSLNDINWEQKVPYIQSLEISIKILIEYLKPGDYKEGLRLSYIIQRLGEITVDIPGSKETKDFYETYIEIGELLNGNIKDATIKSLEEKFERTQFYPRLLIAWCLAKVYKEIGNTELSSQKIKYVKSAIPFCQPLNIF